MAIIPVPGPESNGLSGAAMDTVANRSQQCIQWTSALDTSLLRINDLTGPPHVPGHVARLQALWEEAHPDIPTKVSALTQRLSRHRKDKNMAQPLVGEDSSQLSSAMPSNRNTTQWFHLCWAKGQE